MLEELRRQLEAKLVPQDSDAVSLIHQGHQFLGFRVASQELLVNVDDVREIIMPPPIAFIPRGHKNLEGVIALRGEIMPVVNLRRMLGYGRAELTAATRILIVRVESENFGIIVDEITEFLWLLDEDILPISKEFFTVEFRAVTSVAKTPQAVKPLLNVEIILSEVFAGGEADETQLAS